MENKIIKGDCLEVMKDIPDKSVDMILCDLPYEKFKSFLDWDKMLDLDKLWIEYKRIIKDRGVIVLTAVNPFGSYLIIKGIDLYKYSLVWEKDKGVDFGNSNVKPLNRHEDIHIFYKSKPTYNPQKTKSTSYYKKNHQNNDKTTFTSFQSSNEGEYNNLGDRYPTSIIYIVRESAKREKGLHPIQKPVALFEYLIKTYTNEGDLVLDNCAGSGTTGVACKNLNRNFILIEKEEKYIKIIEERLGQQSATGFTQNSTSFGFPTENSLNKDLEVSASPTPKESQKAIPSLNPDIRRNSDTSLAGLVQLKRGKNLFTERFK